MRGIRGITLIALVITIIILLILAAVTIISVTNHNIIGKASKGTEEYAKGQEYELGEMNNVSKILEEFENKMAGGNGGNQGGENPDNPDNPGDTTLVDKETSYVGYYADIDRDGTVDGIIYADMAKGNTGSGQWGNNNGTYTIPVKDNLKEYYVSKTGYEGPFGIKDVLSPKGTGNERFYVMALTDIDGSQNGTRYCWYNAAYSTEMTDWETTTSGDFGTGRANTETMIAKWDAKAYGEQNKGAYKDLWGEIKEEVAKGWYVPSRGEWAAFGEELGITKENYTSYGLSNWCWASSQGNTIIAWRANFNDGYMNFTTVFSRNYVRLGVTF